MLRNSHLASSSSFILTITIWNPTTGQLVNKIGQLSELVVCLAVLDNNRLAGGAKDGSIQFWSTITGNVTRALKCHSKMVSSLALLKKGEYLASSSYDKTIKIFSLLDGQEIRTLLGYSSCVYSLAVLNGGEHLASSSYDTTIRIWCPYTGTWIRSLTDHVMYVTSLTVLNNGHLTSGSWDGVTKT